MKPLQTFKVLGSLIAGKNLDDIGGEAFFITDGNPVNNLKFFLEPLLPALCGTSKLPRMQIPLIFLIMLGMLFNLMSRVFGTKFTLPVWALTLTEAYKVAIR